MADFKKEATRLYNEFLKNHPEAWDEANKLYPRSNSDETQLYQAKDFLIEKFENEYIDKYSDSDWLLFRSHFLRNL